MAVPLPTGLTLDLSDAPPPPPPPPITQDDLVAGTEALRKLFGGRLPRLPALPFAPHARPGALTDMAKKIAKASDPRVTAAFLQYAGAWMANPETGVLASEAARAGDAESLALLAAHNVRLDYFFVQDLGQTYQGGSAGVVVVEPAAVYALAQGDPVCVAIAAAVHCYQRLPVDRLLRALNQVQDERFFHISPISYRTPDRVAQFELAVRIAVHDLAQAGRLREVFHDRASLSKDIMLELVAACAKVGMMGNERLRRLLVAIDAQLGLGAGQSALANAAWGHPHFASAVATGGNVACMRLLIEGLHVQIAAERPTFCQWLWHSPHTTACFGRIGAVFPPFWILFLMGLPAMCLEYRAETKTPLQAARNYHHGPMVEYLESIAPPSN